MFIAEEHDNGDVWSCLPDGADEDLKSDGCVKVVSVVDSDAEPTGLFFGKDGRTAYLSMMHPNDANMPLVNGWPTDDIVKIIGFKVKQSGLSLACSGVLGAIKTILAAAVLIPAVGYVYGALP